MKTLEYIPDESEGTQPDEIQTLQEVSDDVLELLRTPDPYLRTDFVPFKQPDIQGY